MPTRLEQALESHWPAAALVAFASVGGLVVCVVPHGSGMADGLLWAVGGALAAAVCVAIAQLWKRRWRHAFGTVAATLPIAALGIVALVIGGVQALFADEDHFADDLPIPAGVALREPGDRDDAGAVDDPAGAAVVAIARERDLAASPSATIPLHLPSLDAIGEHDLERLRARLAASPHWHVGEEHGRSFAYRRFEADPHDGLHDSLNGYYHAPGASRREWRVVLGFGGTVYADRFTGVGSHRTSVRTGTIDLVGGPTGDSFPDPTTHLTLEGRPLVVEVSERAHDADRAITRAALALVEETLAAFLRGESLGPSTRGAPTFDLSPGMQPGIYTATAMLNPREPGQVYVRAFEITHNVELSASRLRDRTLRDVGSSPDEVVRNL